MEFIEILPTPRDEELKKTLKDLERQWTEACYVPPWLLGVPWVPAGCLGVYDEEKIEDDEWAKKFGIAEKTRALEN